MLRILLVIDDYNELIYLQTLLKKMGFDVEGLQNQKKYSDVSLGFNPHILLTTARGAKVNGLQLAQGLNKARGLPKIIALRQVGQRLSPEELEEAQVDDLLDSPINPKKLLSSLARLGGLSEEVLHEKYSKVKGVILETDGGGTQRVSQGAADGLMADERRFQFKPESHDMSSLISGPQEATFPIKENDPTIEGPRRGPEQSSSEMGRAERQKRFENWAQKLKVEPDKKFDRDKVREFNKKIRSYPAPDDIDEIEGERRQFVAALYKTKSSKK